MNLDQDLPPAEPISSLPPARRRRARRSLLPASNDERSVVLENLARKAFPSFEFFLFSILAGAILGAGYIFDSQSILLLGVLIAPLMAPWVGINLATVTGSGRFFLQTLSAFVISSALLFGASWLAGIATDLYKPQTFMQAIIHTHLWWADLFVLVLGSVLLVISFVRSEERPILPSIMLSYGLFLPLSAAGFGLGSGVEGLWPNGGLVFCIHLALATLAALLTLFVLGFRPRRFSGCFMTLVLAVLALVVFAWLSGVGTYLMDKFNIPFSASAAQNTPTASSTIRAVSATPVPITPTTSGPTLTPTLKIPASVTPTNTSTPQPTPVYARIYSTTGEGANVRANAGADQTILVSLVNDTLVEVLPEIQIVNGITWLHIRTSDGIVGWIIQSLVVTATPAPGW
jgi:uncharacterized membrane protein